MGLSHLMCRAALSRPPTQGQVPVPVPVPVESELEENHVSLYG